MKIHHIGALLAIALTGCSGAQLKTDWEGQRGYPENEIDAMMSQAKEYQRLLISAKMNSNAFNSAPYTDAQNRLRAIFCTCVKKMGNKCRDKSGMTVDRSLWRKANAVDMAFVMDHTALDSSPAYVIDPAECPTGT